MRWFHAKISFHMRALLAGALLAVPAGVAASAMTLNEAIELAISTNPDIGIVASNREAVEEELRQARGLYLPQVDMFAGYGRERTDDRANRGGTVLERDEASVTLQQRIFDGFEAGNTVERDEARLESAALRVAENAEFLGLDAIAVYVEVLRQRELVRLAEENLRSHLETLNLLKKRLAGGAGSRADVAQTEARSARARATLTQSLNDLRDSEAAFSRVVGQFPDKLDTPRFPAGVLPDSLEAALGLAEKNNPTTRIFDADVKAATAAVSLSESPFYPRITLEAESEYNDGRDGVDTYEFNNQVMLRLRWNWFRGGIDNASRKEALARLSESKNRRLQSFLVAQQEMRESWFAYEASQQRVKDLADSVKFNLETRNAYRQQFQVARRTLLDVLDAENELFVSKGQLVTAQTNQFVASNRVLAVAGQLLKILEIPTPDQAQFEDTGWFGGVFR